MGKILDGFRGVVRIEIQGAFYESLLNQCALEGISLWDFDLPEKYIVQASGYESQLAELELLCKKCGCELKLIKLRGGSKNRRALSRRKWLLIFLLFSLLMLLLSSMFIWEIEVRGAEEISRGKILRALDDCGIKPGVFRFSFSPDLVRSRMLSLLPELGWMTVNVSGSVAVVLLEPRVEKPEIYTESAASYIVAAKTGIIRELNVFNGFPLAAKDQAVLKGETLVSGVMESLSNEARSVRAMADIMADTWYEISAIYPEEVEIKEDVKWSYSRFSLKIGKKRINFYFGGRNDIDGCVKIMHEYNLGAEGLFALPISLVKEKIIFYREERGSVDIADEIGMSLVEELSGAIDGEIVSSSLSVSDTDGLSAVTLRAACYENIAMNIDMNSAPAP